MYSYPITWSKGSYKSIVVLLNFHIYSIVVYIYIVSFYIFISCIIYHKLYCFICYKYYIYEYIITNILEGENMKRFLILSGGILKLDYYKDMLIIDEYDC